MHIECKIKREGGSHIPLGNITYHFAPQPDDAHVALVENPDHQDIFLGIKEGYRIYRGEHKPAAAVTIAELGQGTAPVENELQEGSPDLVVLEGSTQHEAEYIIHGTTYPIGAIINAAVAASGLSAQDWNSLSDDGRADLIDVELEKLNEAGPVTATDERAELAAQYKAKTGNAPHHTWDAEKIRAKLAE